MIRLGVDGQRLCLLTAPHIIADSVNYIEMIFEMTEEWKNITAWAEIIAPDGKKITPMIVDGEITADKGLNLTAGEWTLSLIGDKYENGEVVQRITTNTISMTVKPSGIVDGEPFVIDIDAGSEIIAEAARYAAEAHGEVVEANKVLEESAVLLDIVKDVSKRAADNAKIAMDAADKVPAAVNAANAATKNANDAAFNAKSATTQSRDLYLQIKAAYDSGAFAAKINGVNTLNIEGGKNITIEQNGNTMIIHGESSTSGYVFDTVAEMQNWVANHRSELKIGDNLYIRETNVPDYWWDGSVTRELESQSVNLSEYPKRSEMEAADNAINGHIINLIKVDEPMVDDTVLQFIPKGEKVKLVEESDIKPISDHVTELDHSLTNLAELSENQIVIDDEPKKGTKLQFATDGLDEYEVLERSDLVPLEERVTTLEEHPEVQPYDDTELRELIAEKADASVIPNVDVFSKKWVKVGEIVTTEEKTRIEFALPNDTNYFSVRSVCLFPAYTSNGAPGMAIRVGTGVQIGYEACVNAITTSASSSYYEFVECAPNVRVLKRKGGSTGLTLANFIEDSRRIHSVYFVLNSGTAYPVGTKIIIMAKEREF